MENEELLIKSAAKGNENAFRILVEKYQRIVYNICLNVVKDPQHAENVAQETFLQLYKSISKYEYKGFKTWLGRIALNKAIDYQRKFSLYKHKEINFSENIDLLNVHSEEDFVRQLEKEEDNKQLLKVCNELPEAYRNTINKYYIQEKCYAEIAFEEGISIKTVESRLYRAKKMLKEKMEGGGLT